ncbi:MAG: AzlC family ABC transporter permease [Pseudomonadota bacterium]
MTQKQIYKNKNHKTKGGFWHGVALGLGVPGLILGTTFIGFGSLVRESGIALWMGLFSTATAWAVPGQLALVELYAIGASSVTIVAAVALTNARLLPMSVVLLPELRSPGAAPWKYYLAAHYIAVTGWALAMKHCPTMPPEQRLSFFTGLTLTLWSLSLFGTAIGFFLAGSLPNHVTIGLVFMNPIYFMLIFASDLAHRARTLAMVFGAVAGPLMYLATPDWGLLLTGLIAGSVAFVLDRIWQRRND